MVPISGFTLVRNAIRLDFPVEASIRSLLALCDEVVVNVGASDDGTLDLIRGIGDPRVRILETEWNLADRDRVLRDETLRAMRACRHTWGMYIQADEVLHEDGVRALRAVADEADEDLRVEGLLVRYHHLFGDPDTEAVNRRWYRREVRMIRLDARHGIRPFRDAQGFRVGPDERKIRARIADAEMFHYGYTRSAAALRGRKEIDRVLYPWMKEPAAGQPLLEWFPGLRPFTGRHPAAARAWVASHARDPDRIVSVPRFKLEHLRFYASDLIERSTGRRLFEFRNYSIV